MEPEKLNLTLQPGRNCWRIDHAERFALLVDAAAYFKAVKEAFLTARHSIFLIGWDFDTRIKFEPEGSTLDFAQASAGYVQLFELMAAVGIGAGLLYALATPLLRRGMHGVK